MERLGNTFDDYPYDDEHWDDDPYSHSSEYGNDDDLLRELYKANRYKDDYYDQDEY